MYAPKAMNISVERADAPGVRELLELSDEFHAALYPPEGNYLLDITELLQPGVTVVVARDGERAVGMGAGVDTLQLETGPLQPAAIAFYERNGFTRIPNFGEYADSEYSVCFAKRL